MNRKQRINELLKKNLKEFNIQIEDNSHLHTGHNEFTGKGETHIKILLKKNSIKQINRVDIHRKINTILKKEFSEGMHSLEIRII
tara:strand:+ start:195 stop:449 length:255 start_codon:yes stop_codon:yes gene_type:complete